MSGRIMTASLAALSLFCLCVALLTGGAFAQASRCGPRAEIVKVLAEKYHELPRIAGAIEGLAMMEAYVSERGTWTIVVTNSAGLTCLMAAGHAWDELPPLKKGKPS